MVTKLQRRTNNIFDFQLVNDTKWKQIIKLLQIDYLPKKNTYVAFNEVWLKALKTASHSPSASQQRNCYPPKNW